LDARLIDDVKNGEFVQASVRLRISEKYLDKPGTVDTIFTISGIYFLYNFLVRLSGKTGNGVHSVQKNWSRAPENFNSIFRDLFSAQSCRKTLHKSARSARTSITERTFPPAMTKLSGKGKNHKTEIMGERVRT